MVPMKTILCHACIAFSFVFALLPVFSGAQTGNIAVWDTGSPSAVPLAPEAVASEAPASATGWTFIPWGSTATFFAGDAVMGNGRLTVVVRAGSPAAEVYCLRPAGAVLRARLTPKSPDGKPADSLERAALVENTAGGACLKACYRTAGGGEVATGFRLKPGEVAVETFSAGSAARGAGAGRLRVECDARFTVLPDFFAADLGLDARKIPPAAVSVPSDSFILNMTGNGDSVVACVFENREQDVRMTLSGDGEGRHFTGSEIAFGKGKKIWVALLEGAGVWNAAAVEPGDAGRVMRLDWKMPFAAVWRADFTREDGLTDSWEMLLQEKEGGEYVKPGWLGGEDSLDAERKRWTTVLGEFPYPCWSDHEGRGYLQPLDSEELKFAGPVIMYPINRIERTPSDTYTVVDVMRNALGVGPCEYVLDLEGQRDEWRGSATCSVRDTLNPIYEKGEQKSKRAEVKRTLDDGLVFVRYIRSRINQYIDFGHELLRYLALQKIKNPRQKKLLREMEKLAREIDARVTARVKEMKTPAHVARMNARFRKSVLGCEGPDALERCKKYTEDLVRIGSNQDELVGECRWVVKALRQRAGILVATDPAFGPTARRIRAMTEKVLRKPAGHEGARH
jgi:hypothetical protein